jgi:alcohol dehydrogenase class IV
VTFEFAAPGRILFGRGRVAEAGAIAKALACGAGAIAKALARGAFAAARAPACEGGGARALVVTGSDAERAAPLIASLETAGLSVERYAVRGEPSFEDAGEATALARSERCSVIVGFGGGSALDLAKAVAALLANPGDPFDYAEVIGGGKALSEPSYPCIAIPTTAGTGSEATRNAVLSSAEHRVKVSLRSATMLPAAAIIDPELTFGLPPGLTAQTGMDALAQLLESFVCSSPNPLVDAICREALPLAARSLPAAFEDGSDAAAREGMCFAGLSGGLALANARLGAVHGIAGPLGGAFPVPHGAACAALMAPVAAANVRALRVRGPGLLALERYAEAAAMLGGGPGAAPEDLPRLLAELASRLGIGGLARFGVTSEDFPEIAKKAAASSSMRGNPIVLAFEEILEVLEKATFH